MDLGNAQRLLSDLPDAALVLDVGGGAAPFPRADYVIDALPFESAGAGSHGSAHKALASPPRYAPETWIQADLCARTPWPFADKSFDYAVCSHLLEDVRDPIWICSELRRVAKAGYIEVPSRIEEQSRGVEHPGYCGYHHHRWLVSLEHDALVFRHKPHLLHTLNDAIVANLTPGWKINPSHAILAFFWHDDFEAQEALEFSERATVDELCEFARNARPITDLTVPVPMPLVARLKRHMLYRRLSRGRR